MPVESSVMGRRAERAKAAYTGQNEIQATLNLENCLHVSTHAWSECQYSNSVVHGIVMYHA